MQISEAQPNQGNHTLLSFSGDAAEIEKLQRLCLDSHCLIQQLDQQWLGQFSLFQLAALRQKWAQYFGQPNVQLTQIWRTKQILWTGPGFKFDLTVDPFVYAIINCTPDSFYDGQPSQALGQIMTKIEADLANGAAVIEVGGKSTRPGYQEITPDEEWQRIAPVIAAVQQEWPNAILAVDTNNADVMQRAVASGVPILNDIDGFDKPAKLEVVAQHRPAVVTMYNGRHYQNDVFEILDQFYQETLASLEAAGLTRQQIALDPGVGFSHAKNTASLDLFKLDSIQPTMKYRASIMAGISRKSFMESKFDYPMAERLTSTLLLEQLMIEQGARILRVHDVLATHKMINLFKGYQQADLLMAARS